MQCTWQTRSGIGGDRGADLGILAARMQGAEPAGNDVSTLLDGMKARAARAHARLKSIGVPTHERIWWLPDHPYHHAVTLLPCCHEHHRPAPEFAIDSLLEEARFEPSVPPLDTDLSGPLLVVGGPSALPLGQIGSLFSCFLRLTVMRQQRWAPNGGGCVMNISMQS